MVVELQIAIHLVEALHDKYVIAGSDKSGKADEAIDKWHKVDALQWTIVHVGFSLVTGDLTYIFTGLTIRWALLQLALNYLRGLPLDYLGNGPIDKMTKKLFPKMWSVVVKAAAILFCITYETLKYHELF